MMNRISIFIKFMLSGGPTFFLAMALNFVLVEHFEVDTSIAYCFILLFQLFINFVILKLLVFTSESRLFNLPQMARFFSGVLVLRILDYLFYTFLVNTLSVYFLYAQIVNMILFSVCRFLFSEKILTNNQ